MRPLYIDINGTTDASGNASIPVAMPRMTGRWHNAKFTLGMSGPGEWSILVNGRPYTHGRGRRVTLGPELIQDGETATISVIGGPPKATIDGTATGVSGTPDEIMSTYAPAPNTIALDTFAQQALLGSILTAGLGAPASKTFTIPPGTQGVGYMIDQNAGHSPPTTNSGITMVGSVSAYPYITFSNNASGVLAAAFVEQAGSTEFFASVDPAIVCTVTDPNVGTPSLVYFYAYAYNPKVRSDLSPQGSPVNVNNVSPALWQAFPLSARVDVNAVAADTAVIGGAASQTIRLGVAHFFSSAATRLMIKDGNGGTVKYVIVFPAVNAAPIIVPLNGLALTSGNGLFINTTLGNEMEFSTTYSQG